MLEQLREIIVNYVDVETANINENSRFVEDLGFNSFDFMSMIGEIEEIFDIEVDERAVLQVKTVGDAVAYIEQVKQ